jgi:hypothetical protein
VRVRYSFFAILFVLCGGALALPLTLYAQSETPKLKQVPLKEAEARHKPGDTVAVVNGVIVTFADFNSIMSGYLKAFVARSKDNVITDSLYTIIVDSAWDRAVSDILVEQEIVKRKLDMSIAMIKDSLVHNPPDFLRTQFTDSLGAFRPEIMQKALDDPRNDTIVSVILEGERVRLETERLVASIAKKGATGEARETAFTTWLRRTKRAATIDDRRTRFGFY